jgi:hypothetical protein
MRQRFAILWLTLVIAALGVVGIAAPVAAGDAVVTAALTGSQEVPPADPDGSGEFWGKINIGQGTLCYSLTARNIDPPAFAAHVHLGQAGHNGDVIIPLIAPTSGSSSGCASADRALLKSIRENPSLFYVNVHNATYPGGAIRGQLS